MLQKTTTFPLNYHGVRQHICPFHNYSQNLILALVTNCFVFFFVLKKMLKYLHWRRFTTYGLPYHKNVMISFFKLLLPIMLFKKIFINYYHELIRLIVVVFAVE
uniref:(northern house mosquito) hypothetical protein n=1 Tax=Culex pipiens TaxID=7175 RepID=A0A8D8IQU2_CULPI